MALIRVVLDTNVVVSAYINPKGLERLVFNLCVAQRLGLYISQPIFAEYSRVFVRPRLAIGKKLAAAALALNREKSLMKAPRIIIRAASDPDDNKFLECAHACKAHFLVTGNKQRFPISWQGTRILNAKDLLSELIMAI